ncbi:MAG: hypothetical protein JST68_17220 [Bacteroidetes bacterium]|nr:hypothetical protein [Bacteroidota bacterium]
MKRYFIISLLLIAGTTGLRAQRTGDQDIQDSVIGWWSNTKYDHLPTQTTPAGKQKEAIVNDMIKWMKTSYTPVGGLGTWSRYIGKMGYGVNFLVWNVSHDKRWTEPDGRFRPIPEENTKFNIQVNQLFGAWAMDFINTGSEYYFTVQPDGYFDNTQARDARKGTDTRIHPNCYKFVTVMNSWCVVYLVPANKLPWIPVTRGELLDKAEAGLEKVLADKRKEVATQWPDKKNVQDEVLADFKKNNIERFRSDINKLRAQGSLDKPAVVRNWQNGDIYTFSPNMFQVDDNNKAMNQAYPVYKVDAATMAKMGDVTPQWVAIAWPFERREDGNQLHELFTAMSQNINYDYIFDYFFAPEKVKGRPYTASDEAGLKARLAAVRATNGNNDAKVSAKQGTLKDGVLLFDDFSQESEGARPAGWYYKTAGTASLVSKVPGVDGKWLKLGYANQISSTVVKTLPDDFNIEFDLLTGAFDENWGASLDLEMGGQKDKAYSSFKLDITAGNQSALDAGHNYRGEVRISFLNSPSTMPYNDQGGFFAASQPVFTSTKRKVHIRITKKGDGIKVFLNEKEFADTKKFKTKYNDKDCGDCSIRPDIKYGNLKIQSFTQDAGSTGCYIGNIKISKG